MITMMLSPRVTSSQHNIARANCDRSPLVPIADRSKVMDGRGYRSTLHNYCPKGSINTIWRFLSGSLTFCTGQASKMVNLEIAWLNPEEITWDWRALFWNIQLSWMNTKAQGPRISCCSDGWHLPMRMQQVTWRHSASFASEWRFKDELRRKQRDTKAMKCRRMVCPSNFEWTCRSIDQTARTVIARNKPWNELSLETGSDQGEGGGRGGNEAWDVRNHNNNKNSNYNNWRLLLLFWKHVPQQ